MLNDDLGIINVRFAGDPTVLRTVPTITMTRQTLPVDRVRVREREHAG